MYRVEIVHGLQIYDHFSPRSRAITLVFRA